MVEMFLNDQLQVIIDGDHDTLFGIVYPTWIFFICFLGCYQSNRKCNFLTFQQGVRILVWLEILMAEPLLNYFLFYGKDPPNTFSD